MAFSSRDYQKEWYLYQNQSIGGQLTAPDLNWKVTLSYKISDIF